ncbi:MAG: YggS family pyridoxal phosphate-dependent enzyme [Pseudomonadota bacterium]
MDAKTDARTDSSAQRRRQVLERIARACRESGRSPAAVELLAVSKQQPAAALRAQHALGQRAFGENRLQEALTKQDELADLELTWHFIGPVQSNKTRDIAARFDWVQSVDREKILRRLGAQRPEAKPPLMICLQVNIDEEPQKAGASPAAVTDLAALCRDLPRLCLRGLMCLPARQEDADDTRDSFQRVAALAATLRHEGHEIDTLSMGMSADLEPAIACGSTMVRVGTDLFGPRTQR